MHLVTIWLSFYSCAGKVGFIILDSLATLLLEEAEMFILDNRYGTWIITSSPHNCNCSDISKGKDDKSYWKSSWSKVMASTTRKEFGWYTNGYFYSSIWVHRYVHHMGGKADVAEISGVNRYSANTWNWSIVEFYLGMYQLQKTDIPWDVVTRCATHTLDDTGWYWMIHIPHVPHIHTTHTSRAFGKKTKTPWFAFSWIFDDRKKSITL